MLSICILGVTTSLLAEENFVYEDKNARDPLWPLVSEDGRLLTYNGEFLLTDLNLEGIMYSPKEVSVAIINGKMFKVNDKMGDYIIDQIQPDKVVLKKMNQIYELKLKKGD